MAYKKTNWTSTTPINTTNLNNIENGIVQNETNIGNLEDLNTTDKTSIVNSINELNSYPKYLRLKRNDNGLKVGPNYIPITWQTASGDTEDLILSEDGTNITVNCDAKILIIDISYTVGLNTTLYGYLLKNGNQLDNKYCSNATNFNAQYIVNVTNGDIISFNIHSGQENNTVGTNQFNYCNIIAL